MDSSSSILNDNDENNDNNYRVFSIQSHVVCGYCGNKSAVFPLQTLGFEVDFINSVQFSTHTGYPRWTGQILNESELLELIDGLRFNQILKNYTHILTGYVRSSSFLTEMSNIIEEIKTKSSSIMYLCDPVMGDRGKMYVPEELLSIYKNKIIPLADIICPNQFEAELLSGIKITGIETALKAIDYFHSLNIKTVIITSTDDGFDGLHDQLMVIGSSQMMNKSQTNQQQQRQLYKLIIPRINNNFTGTGDLFASLFLAWFTLTKFDLKLTMENVVSTILTIIQSTIKKAKKLSNGNDDELDNPFNRELQIIKCRNDIIKPKIQFHAESIDL